MLTNGVWCGLTSKHKTFVKHLYNAGPTSKTLGRRCINVIQMFSVSNTKRSANVGVMLAHSLLVRT